jgi:hypothetical protein
VAQRAGVTWPASRSAGFDRPTLKLIDPAGVLLGRSAEVTASQKDLSDLGRWLFVLTCPVLSETHLRQ